MFCSNCGTKSAENAKFCASCGSAIAAAPAKKPAASRTKKVEPAAEPVVDVTPVAEAPEFEAPTKPASPLAKLTANKGVLYGGVIAVATLVLVFAVWMNPGGPTRETVDQFMVSTETVSLEAKDAGVPDFSGQVLDNCPVDDEISALFASGTTWASGGVKSDEGLDNSFHIHQRIFEADSDLDTEKLKSLLSEVASDSACDKSDSSSFISYSFDYGNGRSISEGFGVNVDGVIIDLDTKICINTCETVSSHILVANRGKVVNLIEYGGATELSGSLDSEVTNLLKKFAG